MNTPLVFLLASVSRLCFLAAVLMPFGPATAAEPTNAAEAAAKKADEDKRIAALYQEKVATLSPERQAWEKILQENLGESFYLPAHRRTFVKGTSTAWDFVSDDPKLPRVLLIGDSISRGYTLTVRAALAGKANVHRAPENCGPTANGLKKLDVWLGPGRWDVIVFNFGIHDRATPEADYENRLDQIVVRLAATGAKLIWASSTPLPAQSRYGSDAAMVARNEIAARLMRRHGVAIADLYADIQPRLAEFQPADDVHFSEAGYQFLGQRVAAAITARQLATDVAPSLDHAFAPPAKFAGQLGKYTSPLKFYGGRPVASPAEWPARRAEILKYWHEQMGPWPELLARPKFELQEKQTRDGITQHRVLIEVAPGVMQHGFLLVPPGDKPRPAVLVPFYAPEPSVAYDGPRPLEGQAKNIMAKGGKHRDFALQLARRGFVTLAIGSPGDNAFHPLLSGAACQPLSYHAYIAANCHTALAQRPEVDPARIGVMGHSYGGKWAMFASCLYEKFACGVWSDGGVVFDESRGNVNYWEPWYLGLDPKKERKRGLVTAENPRTGPYKTIFESGHDLHELHALMAPRPFLVSGGSEDFPARWVALNHAIAVNQFLGFKNRVAMTNRPDHSPNAESNEQAFAFLEFVLRP